jgi:hypothetical protein
MCCPRNSVKEIDMRHMGWFTACALGLGLVAAGAVGTGCKSTHEEGVKSNLHSQWTDVSANTMTTTDAAKAVLMDDGLKDVSGSATNLDGKAMGKMADGTKVNIDVKKKGDSMSQVSVTVGTMGDPKLGADIAKKVKMKAEAMPMK